MKNKGLVLFFAVVIALTCLYCLSFSFVTWKVGKDADRFANDPVALEEALANITDPMMINHVRDSVVSARRTQFLADRNDERVFFGFTYRQAKYKEINLGLDLKGGMNVTLEVSFSDMIKSLAENTEDPLFISAFEKANAEFGQSGGDYIDIFVRHFNAEKNAMNLPNAQLRTYFGERANIKNATDADIVKFLRSETNEITDRTFRILRTRIDRFGVAQPNLQRLQGGRILVELPGVKEPERVTELLKSTAKLEFWEVYNDIVNGRSIVERFHEADQRLARDLKARRDLEARRATQTEVDTTAVAILEENTIQEPIDGAILAHAVEGSDGIAIGFFKESDMKAIDRLLPELKRYLGDKNVVFMWGKPERRSNLYPLIPLKRNNDRVGPKLSSETIGGARVVRSARQDVNEKNQTVVTMAMESQAADEWRKITRAAVDNKAKTTYIAIVLDNFVYSYPRILVEISDGRSEISGNFSIDEAKDLATVLNSGNLEARVNIVQSEVVGPTLGQESIRYGLLSFVIAFILVLLYMFLYYGRAGLVADFALCVNIFFIMGVLASLGAALTLPGIAGIVLAIGMAVDANVLIYERIREEVRAGKGARLALAEGYKNAMPAIIDANVTSLITAIILYIFGSGPIQGFATTLIIGILSSLFTAIFISRLIFENGLEKGKNYKFGNKYTINTFVNAKFDFIKNRSKFYTASISLGVVMIISFFVFGLNPGIDFTGGRNYVVRFDQEVKTNEVREVIRDAFGGNPEVKTFGGNHQVRITTNYKIESNDPQVDKEVETKLFEALRGFFAKTDLTESDFTQQIDPRGIQSVQKVQPTIARELLGQAIWAVLISIVLIFIYIVIRFRNWQFGLGCVIGLAHDTLLTIGLFSLLYKIMPFSMEIDQSFIAAILTVIGYSINNVIIIFDRIRENLNLYPKRENYVNINAAVNSTLGRTINTSCSTILVLLAIFIFGGEVIRGFAFAMTAGIIIGSYSGIFISPPFLYDLLSRAKKIKRTKVELMK
ncbi:MAG: protein translocase subunit SecDF [Bacteroidetes bacterium]|nr:protein translocase subunit SecDF [Bacteroidota bacterium]MCL2303497.1 protein translocase subunit SecDF [Lentimicrobiaceae bacterium]